MGSKALYASLYYSSGRSNSKLSAEHAEFKFRRFAQQEPLYHYGLNAIAVKDNRSDEWC